MAPTRPARRSDHAPALLAFLTLAAFLVRVWAIGSLGLELDELQHAFTAVKPRGLSELWPLLRVDPLHVVLDPLCRFAVARLSASTTALRLPALLLGTANVPLTFLLGRKVGGRRVGLGAAALLACSMLAVEWSRRINLYSALMFWTLASVLALLEAVEKPSARRWVLYAAVQTAFAYTHPYAFLVGAIEAGWAAACERGRTPAVAACLGASAALFLPWFFHATRAVGGVDFHWTEGPDWHGWRHVWEALEGWAQRPEASDKLLPSWTVPFEWAAALAYGSLAFVGIRNLGRRRAWTPSWKLAAALPAAGLAAVLALDARFGYFFATRQTLFALPFYLLLVSYGAEAALGDRAEWALALAAAFFVPLYVVDLTTQREVNEERVGSAEALRRFGQPGDALLFRDPESAQALLYHLDRQAFLSAEPARPYHGVWRFRLPDVLEASSGASKAKVFCLERPGLEPEAQRRRWQSISQGLAAAKRTYYFSFFRPMRTDRLLQEFESSTGVRPERKRPS